MACGHCTDKLKKARASMSEQAFQTALQALNATGGSTRRRRRQRRRGRRARGAPPPQPRQAAAPGEIFTILPEPAAQPALEIGGTTICGELTTPTEAADLITQQYALNANAGGRTGETVGRVVCSPLMAVPIAGPFLYDACVRGAGAIGDALHQPASSSRSSSTRRRRSRRR